MNRNPHETINSWVGIAQGHLGWSGQALMIVAMGVDRMLPGRTPKRARIRRKRMKRILKQIALQDVVDAIREIQAKP